MEQQKLGLAKPVKPVKPWQMRQDISTPPAKTLDEDLTENIEALKEQVEIAIKSVDENLIDSMLVGQTKIQKNKAVILSWSLDQTYPHQPGHIEEKNVLQNGDLTEDQEDGIVLYVAIKMKKKNVKESGETSESETDDWNNNEFKSSDYSEAETESHLEIWRNGSIRSALRRKRAKKNWLRLVTTMRNVNIADCENMFIKDEYRKIVFDEDDLMAVINGEYVVKTPTGEEEAETPNKRVTWRESLEEAFYDTEEEKEEKDDCMIVDISSDSGLARLFPPGRGVKSHSAPSSPVKSPQHRPSVRWPRSRSAERERTSRPAHTRELTEVTEARSPSPGHSHSHVYGDQQSRVRRVRCNHSTNLGQAMWLCGGLNSFNRRVKNRTPATTPSNHYYHYRSKPRASKQTH